MRSRPWWVLLLLPILPLWKALLQGQAIGPWDQIQVMAPWMGKVPERPWDVLQADGALQFYVWRDLVFESWSKFQIPFWNHYQLAGTPLLANSQSGALYPPHMLMGVLHIPTQWAVTLLAWAHLAWAGLGAYGLSKRIGANDAGAIVAGASFILCPFMVAWTPLASVISTVAWIPWLLSLTIDLTSGKGSIQWRTVGLAGLVGGMMLLAGHLQFAAFGFMAMVVVAAFRIKSGGVMGLAGAGIALVCSAAIAAPQLGPVLDYSKFSHRRGTATAEGYQAYASSAIRPFEFGNLVNPIGLGDPRTHASDKYFSDSMIPLSEYWVPLVKPGANFAESAVSPGAVALAFFCMIPIARKKLKNAWGVAAVGVLGLLIALGTPVAQTLYFGVPGWSSTGSPGRAIVLFLLAACVMAGMGVSALTDPDTRPKNPKPLQLGLLAFVFLTAASIGLGITGAKTPEGMDHGSFQAYVGGSSASGIMITLLVAAVAVQPALLGYFRQHGPGTANMLTLSLAAIVATTLFSRASEWVTTGKMPEPVKQSAGGKFDRVAFVNRQWGLINLPGANMPPNLAALYRIHDLAGYDSLLHRDTVSMLREVDGGVDPAPPENGNMMFVKPSATEETLANAGVDFVVVPQTMNPTVGSPVNQTWQELASTGRASVGDRKSQITDETFSSVEVSAEGPGTLVLKDRMMPGWTASVDGAAVQLPDKLWREVELTAGAHKVLFSYKPPNFVAFCTIGVLGWLAAVFAVFHRGSRPSGESELSATEVQNSA